MALFYYHILIVGHQFMRKYPTFTGTVDFFSFILTDHTDAAMVNQKT